MYLRTEQHLATPRLAAHAVMSRCSSLHPYCTLSLLSRSFEYQRTSCPGSGERIRSILSHQSILPTYFTRCRPGVALLNHPNASIVLARQLAVCFLFIVADWFYAHPRFTSYGCCFLSAIILPSSQQLPYLHVRAPASAKAQDLQRLVLVCSS